MPASIRSCAIMSAILCCYTKLSPPSGKGENMKRQRWREIAYIRFTTEQFKFNCSLKIWYVTITPSEFHNSFITLETY